MKDRIVLIDDGSGIIKKLLWEVNGDYKLVRVPGDDRVWVVDYQGKQIVDYLGKRIHLPI